MKRAYLIFLFSQLFAASLLLAEPTGPMKQQSSNDSAGICSCYESASLFCDGRVKPFRLSLSHIEGRGVGYKTGYSSLGLFSAFPMSDYKSVEGFVDLKGHIFNSSHLAANGGLGLRYLSQSSGIVYGINGYYDWRDSSLGSYNQIGPGFEILGRAWSFRANGYIPVGDKNQFSTKRSYDYPGGARLDCRRRETALPGVDAEIGRFFWPKKACDPYSLYFGIGPYYFSRKCGKDMIGGQCRFMVDWMPFIRGEGLLSYDAVNKVIVQGRLTFSIPFGPTTKRANRSKDRAFNQGLLRQPENKHPADQGGCGQECLLKELAMQPVLRHEIIVLQKRCIWDSKINVDDSAN